MTGCLVRVSRDLVEAVVFLSLVTFAVVTWLFIPTQCSNLDPCSGSIFDCFHTRGSILNLPIGPP